MRVRFTLCVLSFFLCAAALFCVPDGRVSVMPKDVYVGDEAEIRFEFSFAEKLFEGDSPSLNVQDLADVSDLPEEVPPGSRSEKKELKRIFFYGRLYDSKPAAERKSSVIRTVDCFYSVENG